MQDWQELDAGKDLSFLSWRRYSASSNLRSMTARASRTSASVYIRVPEEAVRTSQKYEVVRGDLKQYQPAMKPLAIHVVYLYIYIPSP